MYESIDREQNTLIFRNVDRLDLGRCCDCGQAFRWRKAEGGFSGVVRGAAAHVSAHGSDLYIVQSEAPDAVKWANYFDLERDYSAIEALLLADTRLGCCVPFATGIRVFNQEPFETLISFIISANNNIGRITGIVDRLCRLAGERADGGASDEFAFPTPDAIAALSEEQLVGIGSGYRAPFILSSARMVADGFELEALRGLSLDEARARIRVFPGVGPKVADCVLLFSLGYAAAFPVDVWMRRALSALFLDGDSVSRDAVDAICAELGEYSGIIQQYIFHYARTRGIKLKQ